MSRQRPHWPGSDTAPRWVDHLAGHIGHIIDWCAEVIAASLADLHRKVDYIMSQQDELNADVSQIVDASSRIQAEIADLDAKVAANQPLDLSGLKAAADQLSAVVPAPTDGTGTTTDPSNPTDPSVPVTDPTQPVDTSGTLGDGTTTVGGDAGQPSA